jgi:hypothetical protein
MLIFTSKIILRSEKKHAMTLLPFTHGDTWTIPKSLLYLCNLVIIMPAWAKRGSKGVLVLCQSLNSSIHYFRCAA